ncbi:ATPase, T2SS/T4P/T4SS family [Nocardioides sp. B-3]|uniref:ATPase, T2SS/T4P/T4SS family n=1 Tax=Nocardioides sp. B-3 TaxID=2895565 RepID=UPI00215341CA|nr:ATPase, T2SS/T4P/T4SS family [Nocardioides sp. B-3]UUZ59583.1 Flp pilus assembly complex ATPase component TadA [Nocardioides sp. B-3]
MVQGLAAYAGLNSRPWDAANPEVDLTLPDGSRLSGVMGVTPRPSVSIRRHRWEKAELTDTVGNNTITDEAADFLRAIVRARFNVMIAGGTKSGKTTLLRAMAAEIGPEERIVTVENALELGLHKF